MFLEVAHTKLDMFPVAREFVLACDKETNSFPSEQEFGITSQLRRAALSVPLNVAGGCSRKSLAEGNRFYEIARGSSIEVDTAMDIAVALVYPSKEKLQPLRFLIIRTFQLISKMMARS